MELTGELMPEGALTSFTVFNAYRYIAGHALLMTSQSRSRAEHLLPTDSSFSAWCLIDTLMWRRKWQVLIRFSRGLRVFLIILQWLTFLGHSVFCCYSRFDGIGLTVRRKLFSLPSPARPRCPEATHSGSSYYLLLLFLLLYSLCGRILSFSIRQRDNRHPWSNTRMQDIDVDIRLLWLLITRGHARYNSVDACNLQLQLQ